MAKTLINKELAVKTVMKLLSIPGTSGGEGAVSKHIALEVKKALGKKASIKTDAAHKNFPFKGEVGNLVVKIKGQGSRKAEKPILFAAHMDTVTLVTGVKPVLKGNTIRPGGNTALGADDRSGCGVLLTLARELGKTKADHPPVVLAFTVAEEVGLWGARYLDPKLLKSCACGFSYDSGDPAVMIAGAPSSSSFSVELTGIASHAGVHPEDGVSAATVFAHATSKLAKSGWLGSVRKKDKQATSNIGTVIGGEASNIVMPKLTLKGEARSHSAKFLREVLAEIKKAFVVAASSTKNAAGKTGKVKFSTHSIYKAFDLKDNSAVIKRAMKAATELGLTPSTKRQFGGLDANMLNAAGLPTVTLGAGAHSPHTVRETLNIKEYIKGCELACKLAIGE